MVMILRCLRTLSMKRNTTDLSLLVCFISHDTEHITKLLLPTTPCLMIFPIWSVSLQESGKPGIQASLTFTSKTHLRQTFSGQWYNYTSQRRS